MRNKTIFILFGLVLASSFLTYEKASGLLLKYQILEIKYLGFMKSSNTQHNSPHTVSHFLLIDWKIVGIKLCHKRLFYNSF